MNDLPAIPVGLRAPLVSPLQLIGCVYKRGGITPVEGFDCYTLLAYVRWHWFKRATPGEPVVRRVLSPAVLCAVGIRRALRERSGEPAPWQQASAPHEGCAVALGRSRIGRMHHCGVWVTGGVLHALDTLGVVWTPGDRISTLYKRVAFYELPTCH